MIIKTASKAIENIYEFSHRIGHAPAWVDSEISFEETLQNDEQSVTMLITQHPEHLEFMIPWRTFDHIAGKTLSCLMKYLLEMNLSIQPLYFAIRASEHSPTLVLRSQVFLSPDVEANIGHYLMVRAAIVEMLDGLNQDLDDIIQQCQEGE